MGKNNITGYRILRVDSCSSVFHRISAANLQALQSVLNAGARLIMQKRKYEQLNTLQRHFVTTYTGCLFVSE